jgi:hypothetical protein
LKLPRKTDNETAGRKHSVRPRQRTGIPIVSTGDTDAFSVKEKLRGKKK